MVASAVARNPGNAEGKSSVSDLRSAPSAARQATNAGGGETVVSSANYRPRWRPPTRQSERKISPPLDRSHGKGRRLDRGPPENKGENLGLLIYRDGR